MNRSEALKYISYILDDALAVHPDGKNLRPDAVLVGWQVGFEPMFVAVQSYLPGVKLDVEDAVNIAGDYLQEIGWFTDEPTDPDYIID